MSDKQTMERLFIPNTNELSMPVLFKALIRKNREPKLNAPKTMPSNMVFLEKSCTPFFFVNNRINEATNEMANKEEEKRGISFSEIYRCCAVFTNVSTLPDPMNRMMGKNA